MLAPCGRRTYRSWTSGYECNESAVTSSRPSSAHSFSVWMSRRTCSNSNSRVSISPEASAQNMNASSGSGLWPRRISTSAGGYQPAPRLRLRDVSKPVLTESIQDYLKEIYKLGAEGDGASVSALARRQGVSAASASAMVKKLAALDLAEHQPYGGIVLTPSGGEGALEVIR